MARTQNKKASTTKKPGRGGSTGRRSTATASSAQGKHLVIVESPTKAKTINKYLGPDYLVMASVGHVRDLPSRSPKGVKQEVPGVDVDNDFEPTYEVLPDKKKTVTDLKKAAKVSQDVWFATDLDREGEAIAWHLAQALGLPIPTAKRVVFNAITKNDIQNAFSQPRSIDENKVNAQQARRILDRIVGYQVSPLLWKKVAGGLSAGRVQSVAVRVVVEREREIEAFVPDEFWKITGYFATDPADVSELADKWQSWLDSQEDGKARTGKEKQCWLNDHRCLRGELVEIGGQPFKVDQRGAALDAAKKLGFVLDHADETEDPKAKGPAKAKVVYTGHLAQAPSFSIQSITTKRVTSRPSAPFITSTLQQTASTRLGFALRRTMRVAQQLYEGIDIHGNEGQVGLITYMRTDSTHLSPESIEMARSYIHEEWGDAYVPGKANVYSSPNKSAQEAHEAIRPTDVRLTPQRVRRHLNDEQFKLYQLIWERFLASQMTPAKWDSTTVLIESDPHAAVFKASGKTLVFDGFYRVLGVPNSGGDAILPPLAEDQTVAPLQIDPTQHFTSPPPRYTEASLQKRLEEEGIGRPSTYAPIIQTVQDRKYVQQVSPKDRRLYATDLGKVVTDKLVEAFPKIMDVAYTREMETELDKIENDDHEWVGMLRRFYGPFKTDLDEAHKSMVHAKAETQPAPYKCETCGADTFYRFGRNGRFLSCSRYPDCKYAVPVDHEGTPLKAELSDIVCPDCGGGMTRRRGRFGPFLGCENYPECKGIVKLDPKKGTVVLPKPPPMKIDLPCPKCEQPLNMRRSKRGPWLSCSAFPKCRGRAGWSAIEPDKQQQLEKALEQHEAEHPVPQIRTTEGVVIGDDYVPRITGDHASDQETGLVAGQENLDSDAA